MDLKILHKVSYGLYVVSSKSDGKFNGQIANAVFQVTSEPPTVVISINKQNLTHEFIQKSGVFTVSILSKETPMAFIGDFGFKSGRDIDKFRNINYREGATGAPIVSDNLVGYLEAEVVGSMDVGTHTLFVGKIVDAGIVKDGEPMTYDYYRQIKKGLTPKAAATYIKEEESQKATAKKSDKYRCTVCGYVYDPEKGDPDSGIKPGTPFEKLPDNWTCPVCGADKSAFEKE